MVLSLTCATHLSRLQALPLLTHQFTALFIPSFSLIFLLDYSLADSKKTALMLFQAVSVASLVVLALHLLLRLGFCTIKKDLP
jgi:hypothetical protein